jgi:hypothetical protein
VANVLFGWRWPDSIAAVTIAGLAVKDRQDAWRGEACCTPVLPQRATAITGGIGSLSLAMGVAVAGTDHGGWVAVVGVPRWGVVAAQELGVSAERTALVPEPGTRWAAVVSSLSDGMRMVVARPTVALSQRMRLWLQNRVWQTDFVLLILGEWADAAVHLSTSEPRLHGIYPPGHGRLSRRELTVYATRRSGRPASTRVWLPNKRGQITTLAPTRLVECWWSGSWGRWHQIRLKLEDAGVDGRVAVQEGPDGFYQRTYHHHHMLAVAQLQAVIDEHDHLPWRDITAITQRPRPGRPAPTGSATASAPEATRRCTVAGHSPAAGRQLNLLCPNGAAVRPTVIDPDVLCPAERRAGTIRLHKPDPRTPRPPRPARQASTSTPLAGRYDPATPPAAVAATDDARNPGRRREDATAARPPRPASV